MAVDLPHPSLGTSATACQLIDPTTLTALRAVEAFLCDRRCDAKVRNSLLRLHRIVEPVRSQVPFQHVTSALDVRARLFAELRQVLRLRIKCALDNVPTLAFADAAAINDLQDIEHTVERLVASLRHRRPERGPAHNARQAIDLILDHIQRHGPSLWGHVISLPKALGGGARLVDRTNLLIESFFHRIKHGERRRSGRKTLGQDLENLPGAALLATNLTKTDYVEILCGSLDQLPAAFAQLDANHRSIALPVRKRLVSPHSSDLISSSLPSADRSLFRSASLHDRVLAAAQSRPPRLVPTRHARSATVD